LGLHRAQQETLLAARTGARPSSPPDVPAPPQGSLPVPATSFVGRERETRETVDLLQREGVRLVTLTGAGGVGKTRLALAVASTLATEGASLTFVSLAPVRDPALVTSAIAQALGIREDGDRSLTDAIVSALGTRHVLLIFDNFEHVVEAAPLVATLLAACPHLQVLVTSRALLHLSGEHNVPVPPLALPDPERQHTVEQLAGSAAIRLFVARAAAARADFVLMETNAPMVAGICQRLEGLPLAIELAAARVTHLPLASLQARLEHSLPLLTGGPCDAPARLRTMRDAIAWSYDLLSPEAQWLFRRLAVFVGGATLEVIMAVIAEEDWVTVLKGIEPLVDQSLLYQVADHTGEPRFRMLEPIREFGLEHLASHGEERAARDAHAAWCLTLGERTFAVLRGSGRSQWFDLMETELGNLRAAFTWLAAQDRAEDAVDLGMGLFFFFHTRGYHSEAFALFEGFLRHPRIALRTRSRAKALLGHGILVEMQGAVEPALEQMLESVDIFREVGDPVHTGLALTNVGIAYSAVSDFDRAAEAHWEVIAIGRETNDAWLLKAGNINLGTVLNDRGEVDQAIPLFEEALAMARIIGDVYGIELGLLNLAEVFLMQEKHERAEPLIQEAFVVLAGLGHRADLSAAKMLLAQVARARGDYAAATVHLEDGLATARSIDDKVKIARALLALGDIARLQGDVAGAIQQFREGIALSQQIGNRADLLGEGLEGVAGVAVATGAMHQAARLLGAADALLEAIGATRPTGARSADYENHARAARDALDNDDFSAAWSEGRALTLDDAAAEAIAFTPIIGAAVTAAPDPGTGSLSPRELEVLRLMAKGLTNQEIADALFVSRRTVSTHVTGILTKLNASSRSAAAVYAVRHGLV
jgi:predicted ATPase/DNA-binding CsgD family transcriptional regulator